MNPGAFLEPEFRLPPLGSGCQQSVIARIGTRGGVVRWRVGREEGGGAPGGGVFGWTNRNGVKCDVASFVLAS